ncbi:SigB/SigF/SigG family RNA polymerase sigma factor [Pseudonocardia alaniniphila]|uniref:SigB/SigF/SigG family RNA polymerase sigma factor n=1 Tax=Pseudonocardia alaniniphila TaxID=75291 RepID=UPI0030B916D8
MRPPLEVAVGRHGQETRLLIQGEVDLSTAAQFSAALSVGLAVGADRLVVDLRGVAFFDCGGLEALARAARQACTERTRLHVVPGAVVGDLAAMLGGWAELPECVAVSAVSEDEPSAIRQGNALTVGVDEPRRGALVLRPDGDLDLATVDLLDDVVTAALADAGRVGSRSIVVDLDRVRFMSAAGVAVLCQGQLRAGADGVSFRLAGGSPVVRRILGVTGASAVLEPYGSVAEALTPAVPLPQTVESGAADPRRRDDDYARLAPLFTERVRLPADDPRQQILRTELIKGYLPVARNVARRYQYRGENLDDLEQVATIGLINAVDRFDPARGVEFLSFAIPTINGEVQRHYRDRTSTIRVPRPIRELQVRVYQVADEMSQKMGRAATPRELALHLGVSLETVIQALQAAYETRPSSLDEPRHHDDGGSDATPIADTVGDVDPELDLVDNRESLTPLLDRLPERRRKIVLLRFYGNMTQTEIAKRTGISQMHVSRLLGSTLAQLRRQLVEGA